MSSFLLRSSRGLGAGILPRTALYNCQKNLFHTTPAAALQQSSRVLTTANKTTTTTTQAGQNNEVDEKKREQNVANEFIEAVLYGSKKIKEEDNQTHSKTLARGKYVHELQSKCQKNRRKKINGERECVCE